MNQIDFLTERDQAFLDAFQRLLCENFSDLQERFGIWRVHEHFEIDEKQVFYETSDNDTQTSTLQIISKDALPNSAVPSTWKVQKGVLQVATWCCDAPMDDPLKPTAPPPIF